MSGSDQEYKGTLEIPNLSDENDSSEVDVRFLKFYLYFRIIFCYLLIFRVYRALNVVFIANRSPRYPMKSVRIFLAVKGSSPIWRKRSDANKML